MQRLDFQLLSGGSFARKLILVSMAVAMVFSLLSVQVSGADAKTKKLSTKAKVAKALKDARKARRDLNKTLKSAKALEKKLKKQLATSNSNSSKGFTGVLAGGSLEDAFPNLGIRSNAVFANQINPQAFFSGDFTRIVDVSGTSQYQISNNAIQSQEIEDGQVKAEDIAAGALQSDRVGPLTTVSKVTLFPTNSSKSLTASCPAGKLPLNGGGTLSGFDSNDLTPDAWITSSVAAGARTWSVSAVNQSGKQITLGITVYCW